MTRRYLRGDWDRYDPRPTEPRPRVAYGVTYAELEAEKHRLTVAQVERNADKIRRVAASLPACALPLGQCPLHSTKPQEFAAPGASTTHNSGGSIGGCFTHGRT